MHNDVIDIWQVTLVHVMATFYQLYIIQSSIISFKNALQKISIATSAGNKGLLTSLLGLTFPMV